MAERNRVVVNGMEGFAMKWNPFLSVPAEVVVQFLDGSADSVPWPDVVPFESGRDELREYLDSIERNQIG